MKRGEEPTNKMSQNAQQGCICQLGVFGKFVEFVP